MILYIGISTPLSEGVFDDIFYFIRDIEEVDTTCYGTQLSFLHTTHGWHNLSRDDHSFMVRENIDARINATEILHPTHLLVIGKG